MKLAIYKYPEWEEDYIWTIEIKERYAELWYKEISRRHWILFRDQTIDLPMYDIDESFELWKMSISHLRDMMDFLRDSIW